MLRFLFGFAFSVHFTVCNIVDNPGFEIPNLSGLGVWDGNGASVTLEPKHVHGGQFALKVSNRSDVSQGPSQHVTLKPASRYVFSVYVKQLNDEPGRPFQSYTADLHFPDITTPYLQFEKVASQPHIQTKTGWFLLKGNFITRDTDVGKTELVVQGPEPGIEFLVDDFSLDEIPENTNWEAEAKSRINKIRKSQIHFIFSLDPQLNPGDVTVRIDLIEHLFGFGAFTASTRQYDSKYKQLLYRNFNWATIPNTDVRHLHAAENTALELHKHGLAVRGQALFGGHYGTKRLIQQVNETTLKQQVQETTHYMNNSTNGFIKHWEVLEDLLALQLFEKGAVELRNIEQVYQLLHEALPSAQLYTAESDILEHGYKTHALTELITFLRASGLNGIAAKTSFRKTPPDPTMLKLRLDELGSAGLPVWISGMDVTPPDNVTMADWFEEAMRMFFSHPAVEGITVTAFLETLFLARNTALFSGHDLQTTETAKRYLDLFHREWTTHIARNLSEDTTFSAECFQGKYTISVYKKGIPVMYRYLNLGKSDQIFQLHIQENIAGISLPTSSPAPVTKNSLLTDTIQHTVSNATSQADHSDLQCVTRWSTASTAQWLASTVVGCTGEEILTGCSTVKENVTGGDWYNIGENVVLKADGQTVCKAVNGLHSRTGVHAVARCCSAKNLQCQYEASGTSMNTKGALAMSSCPQHHVATGCMASQYRLQLHGAYPTDDGKGCLAENGGGIYGVNSAAACCQSPGLTCTTVTSSPSGLKQGRQTSVTCGPHKGYVMTSCNARSESGKMAGAYIVGDPVSDKCVAFNGADKLTGEDGVTAVAVCCHIDQVTPLMG